MSKRTIVLRLVIEDPVPGVTYSLQDKKGAPVNPVVAGDAALAFDVPVQIAPGPKFGGEFVRQEGKERRFVYIAIGAQAGDPSSAWSRRAKIDIHDLPHELLEQAVAPKALVCRLPGRAKDNSPACATIRPVVGWHVMD
ncbi:DUF5990 family protein [Sphingomonas azotifigens]|uniref:DUF5990 family protein n=1 Tax=Sphingomonas azotifigens TaxID=330920 RepID=UPI000A059D3C|nr:DUF5990 family protein [Sphingomonas azotifigens]